MDLLGLGLIQINDWILLFAIICIVFRKYYTWHYDLFTSRGIDGPKPTFFTGNLGEIKESLLEMDIRLWKKYGETYGFFQGRTPLLMTRNREILRHVFVKDHPDFMNRQNIGTYTTFSKNMVSLARDDHWKTLRSICSPTFSTGKLKVMTQQICECAQVMVSHIEKDGATGKSLEMKQCSGAFTMDVIARTAFGLDIDSRKEENDRFVEMGKKGLAPFAGEGFSATFMAGIFAPFLLPILDLFGLDVLAKDVIEFFCEITDRTIEARSETKAKRIDFIKLMMDAHGEKNSTEDKEHDEDFHKVHGGTSKRKLTTKEVRAQGVLFFVAGYDTTSTAIAFTVYNLAINPDIQEKLRQEIDSLIGDKSVDYNNLSELKLLEMCVNESLRMFPPVLRTDRVARKDTNICGVDIPKGLVVAAPIAAIHYDPEIWPEPEKFDPYRFAPAEKANHGPYDWLPFGAGPRQCIAMRLAMAEVKISVLYLVKNFKIIQTEETEIPITFGQGGLLTPKNGIWVKFEKRI